MTRARSLLIGLLLGTWLVSGCGPRENPPSSRAGSSQRDSLAAAGARDTMRTGGDQAAKTKASDPRATALAQRVLAALGGARAWEGARCWYFTYAVGDARGERLRRTHYWERTTGQHRLEGKDRQQRPYIVIHKLGDSAGAIVLRSGETLADSAEVRELARAADSLWVNDSTWLLLPFKLQDSGAQLAYGGTESEGEKTWDLIDVGFDPQPLAPRGRYRLYVERTTGMLERTTTLHEAGKSAPTYEWLGWRIFGGVLLAGERRAVGSGLSILFPQLAVLDTFPAGIFTASEPVVLPAL